MMIRKKLAAVVALCGLTTSPAFSLEEMKPLRSILAGGMSSDTFIYSLRRCAGLMMELSIRNSMTRGDDDAFSVKTYQQMEDFTTAASRLDEQDRIHNGQSIAYDDIFDDNAEIILAIRSNYMAIMDRDYAANGDSLSDVTLDDIGGCTAVKSDLDRLMRGE